MLRNAVGGGWCQIFGKKGYEGVRFNVISVTRGWVGVQFPEKKRYVTLGWPLSCWPTPGIYVRTNLGPGDFNRS